PVPEEENFAMTPLLAPLFEFVPGTQKFMDTNAVEWLRNFASRYDAAASALPSMKALRSNSWTTALDLRAWQAAFLQSSNHAKLKETETLMTNFTVEAAAVGVLEALSTTEPMLDELRAA